MENHELKKKLAAAGEISGIIGNSQVLEDLLVQIRQVASTDATVMIQGESGTGKELIARAIHDQSTRSAGPFIAVNLGALPESLLESELFGHEQGSFTGASRQKPGCFERAIGGTLFLDEITEIPAKSQVDLLRVLESRAHTRAWAVGCNCDGCGIASVTIPRRATDRFPRERLQDLTRRNIVPIHVPPRHRCRRECTVGGILLGSFL